MSDETKEVSNVSSDSVFLVLYILYKANILSSINLKHILKIVKQESPKDIAKYLVDEAAKAY